ncbi:hypothetical protein SKAU_G00275810 [Synaphobranchus kaupii]|uniref:HECT domain-containing protein n=1 Tax=Synaphobranchus kaupii TaxID=118154 RepID=A0A9Q1IQU8_SYNKA|nr:hypothetical protein SKAU_G00275810 [Synaphobranchus kaupii]
MRKGLKDTGVLQLLKARPDTLDVLFPRASTKFIQPQMILDKIIWPSPDSDDDDSLDLESSCRLTGFIRQYIENGNGESLTELIKFWVGWPILPQYLNLEVTHAVTMPTALTCSEVLKIPSKYRDYDAFKSDLDAAVSSTKYGFGLI